MDKRSLSFLSILLIITIPVSLVIWYFFFSNSATYQNGASPIRLFNCLFISIVMTIHALKRGSVDLSGAITGWIFAMIFIYTNYGFLFSLLAIFLVSSKATKYRSNVKSQFEEDYHKSSCRNWLQIVCNLGVAAQLSVFCLIESGPATELPLDFQQSFTSSCLIVSVLGAFSGCLGDTLASELGSVLSIGDPLLITTLKKVPRGTNGGVSFPGLIASGLGGLIIGFSYLISLYLFLDEKRVVINHPQWPILLITFLSGLYGSLLDSFLGAVFQYSGLNTKTGKIVSYSGQNIKNISGFNFLDNHTVNLLSTLITPIFSVVFSIWIYQYLAV